MNIWVTDLFCDAWPFRIDCILSHGEINNLS